MIEVALALVLVAEVDVELAGETTCTTTVAMFEAIDPKVPAPIPLHVALQLTADGPALAANITLDTAGTSTTTRSLDLVAADCPLLPRLVASIAERYVTELPHRDWASFRRQRRLSVVRPRPPPPPPPPPPLELRLSAEGGPIAGIDRRGFGAAVLVSLSGGRARGFSMVGAIGVGSVVGAAIGDGALDVVSVFAGLGPAYRIRGMGWTWTPSLRFVAGVQHGRGRGFDAASSETLPLFDVVPHLEARRGDLVVGLWAPVAIAQPRFVRASTDEAYVGAIVRVGVTVGWSWGW